jgi:hypothetical protein
METETFLLIIWLYLALWFIAIGLILQATKKEDEHSQIFQQGNEKWAEMYVGAIYAIEEEWAERQRT